MKIGLFLLDPKSIILCLATYISLGFIDFKPIFELIGLLSGFSTVFYNFIKSYGEVIKFVKSRKWKKKRAAEKVIDKVDNSEMTISDDQFD